MNISDFDESSVFDINKLREGVTVTITGIPAVVICPHCGNTILDWDVAQQVENLVQPLFDWAKTHTLPKPIVSITFSEIEALAA